MQPENNRVPGGPEQAPEVSPRQGAVERVPVLPTPEAGIQPSAERYEQTAEASAAASNMAATQAPLVSNVVVPATPVATSMVEPPSDSPAVAGDEDLIEKEWVDKAKKIIDETKDDPYVRSQRVNQLQKDYLKKRYDKELGASD